LDVGSTQALNRSPASRPESGPACSSTITDIARADRDGASLCTVEMSAQHGAISWSQFGPARNTHDHNLIGEDRRLLRLVGQSVYAAKADKHRTHYQQQERPPPASPWPGLVRLLRHGATDRMPPRRVPDAG
jgi:hypothetical protein